MRYGNPSIRSRLNLLQDQGCEKIIFFQQDMFYYKFNLQLPGLIWVGTRACKKKNLISPQWLRNIKDKKYPLCVLVSFLILGTRDGLVFLIFGFGIEQFIKKRIWFSLGLFFTSTAWFIFLNNFAYPALNGDRGTVMALERYQAYGANFYQIVSNIIIQQNLLF